MRDQGLGSWTVRRRRMSPTKAALVQAERTVSYAELDTLATRAAYGLRYRGVGRGDRVAYLGLNSIELVVAMLGAAKLGAVFVPLNTRLAPPETAYILTDSEPALLCWTTGFERVAESPEVAATGVPRLLVADQVGGLGLTELLSDDEMPLDEPVGHDDLFMIQYTSGTTGRPKGVQLTHGNIVWNCYNLLVDVDVCSDEVALVTAPLFHTAALNQVLFPILLKGGTSLVEARFDPARAIELIEKHGVTLLFGVTSMYLAIAQAPGWAAADLRTVRSALGGGAPLPQALLEIFAARGLPIIQGYGLTEASPGVTSLRPPDARRKLGSAGTPCFFTDMRIVGSDLAEVAVGEAGEVIVQGPHVTPGYWRNQEATRDAFVEDGWLRTGDLATLDEEGYVRIVDRVKDMYISGGENIYPAEVESVIYTHPAVAECAVVGVPDEHWGEVGQAVVVLRAQHTITETDLLGHLDGKLARYKIPKYVMFVPELPHNASGKVVKHRVRKMVAR
ncbi:AMP-binding protein [Streptomyces sp. SID8361]|uniref:acyl-CoA synthetase n=1 Tax=Streptomyces sp. MnatMP-M27 TaxID=1839768 RepID=UPI00081E1923|nr:long-chain fatty acid--CoA ligase [Streptomyces sp. MnatMP-M27]MYU11158.1 AMP-binding protein [Streptomyces sp. SID8361]SCF78803.1 fatty-acyl-CoA synthase [Streptomyces sp. MnatMP-M27]